VDYSDRPTQQLLLSARQTRNNPQVSASVPTIIPLQELLAGYSGKQTNQLAEVCLVELPLERQITSPASLSEHPVPRHSQVLGYSANQLNSKIKLVSSPLQVAAYSAT
jgi:hypothetical protein